MECQNPGQVLRRRPQSLHHRQGCQCPRQRHVEEVQRHAIMAVLESKHIMQCPRTISSSSAMNSSSPVFFAGGGKELPLLGCEVVRIGYLHLQS
jgi:hypothetical protein